MIFDINKVELKDLDGNKVSGSLGRELGNYLYTSIASLDWLAFAQAVHAGKEAQISEMELVELREIISKSPFNLMAKLALLNYIDNFK